MLCNSLFSVYVFGNIHDGGSLQLAIYIYIYSYVLNKSLKLHNTATISVIHLRLRLKMFTVRRGGLVLYEILSNAY